MNSHQSIVTLYSVSVALRMCIYSLHTFPRLNLPSKSRNGIPKAASTTYFRLRKDAAQVFETRNYGRTADCPWLLSIHQDQQVESLEKEKTDLKR